MLHRARLGRRQTLAGVTKTDLSFLNVKTLWEKQNRHRIAIGMSTEQKMPKQEQRDWDTAEQAPPTGHDPQDRPIPRWNNGVSSHPSSRRCRLPAQLALQYNATDCIAPRILPSMLVAASPLVCLVAVVFVSHMEKASAECACFDQHDGQPHRQRYMAYEFEAGNAGSGLGGSLATLICWQP